MFARKTCSGTVGAFCVLLGNVRSSTAFVSAAGAMWLYIRAVGPFCVSLRDVRVWTALETALSTLFYNSTI